MTTDYFDDQSVARQVLFWTVGARRHLEQWESAVAQWTSENIKDRRAIPQGPEVWVATLDRHMAILCLRHVLRALKLSADPPTLENAHAETIKNVRDLLEHWDENMPVFNVMPHGTPKRKSGQSYAKSHPDTTPYASIRWRNTTGAELAPDLPAPQIHEWLDQLEIWALSLNPGLAEYVPQRRESPWTQTENGEWWPRMLNE